MPVDLCYFIISRWSLIIRFILALQPRYTGYKQEKICNEKKFEFHNG